MLPSFTYARARQFVIPKPLPLVSSALGSRPVLCATGHIIFYIYQRITFGLQAGAMYLLQVGNAVAIKDGLEVYHYSRGDFFGERGPHGQI